MYVDSLQIWFPAMSSQSIHTCHSHSFLSVSLSLKCRLTGDFVSSNPSPSGETFTFAFLEPSYTIRKSRLFCWREVTCGESLEGENDDLPYVKRTHWVTPNSQWALRLHKCKKGPLVLSSPAYETTWMI